MEGVWDVGSWMQWGLGSAAFLFGARALYNFYNDPEPEGCSYLPWPGSSITPSSTLPAPLLTSVSAGGRISSSARLSSSGNVAAAAAAAAAAGSSDGSSGGGEVTADDIVVVDCTHPFLPTLSHHKGSNNPAVVKAADTSTGIVLNALLNRSWSRELSEVLGRRFVTSNHFDVDAFLSVWAYLNRAAAVEHEAVLRHMARIGDFREAFLSPDLISAHGAHDGVTFIREAYTALKLVCWLNTLEQRLFSAPYETQGDCDAKMSWFLPRFEAVLRDPESAWGDWQAEYTQVVSGFDMLAGADCMVETPPGLGLAILSAPEPLHYISLFSHSIGYDVVLMMYDDNRYELECKYTQFVHLPSRPVWPRLDMAPLAAVLNQLEGRCSGQQQQQQQQQPGPLWRSGSGSSTPGSAAARAGAQQQQQQVGGMGSSSSRVGVAVPTGVGSLRWLANSLTDSGPLLRLQGVDEVLTKAQRYGQPFERYIHSSNIPPQKMQAIVQSFLGFGLHGLKPRLGGWEWSELQELNAAIHWQDWASCVVQQASQGALDSVVPPTAAAAAGAANDSSLASAAIAAGSSLAPSTPRRLLRVADARQQQQQVELAQLGGATSPVPPGGMLSPVNLSVPGLPLPAGQGPPPVLSQPSVVASPAALAALAAVLPPLHQGNPWLLLYSTARDGISLGTLMRKAEKVAPSLLLVKDVGGAVFGAYVSDAWRYNPRFYGTGETFVFQLEPCRLTWPWLNAPGHRNDFFQYATHEVLGVGGAGHWAISLDEDLIRGSSRPCDTFGSPCLASREEFEIVAVELWHVH